MCGEQRSEPGAKERGLVLPGGLQDRHGRFLLRLLLRDRATCDPAVSACFCYGRRSWLLVNSRCTHHSV